MLNKFAFIYFIIFASLFLVPFVFCQEKCTDAKNINNRYDCLKFSTSNKLCCYNPKGSCEEVDFSKLKNKSETLDCGVVDNRVGEYEFSIYHPNLSGQNKVGFQTCGAKKPKKAKDCTKYSQLTNSCCYFIIDGEKVCYSIGKKFSGEKKNSYEIEGIKYEYECKGNFLNTIINQLISVFILLYLSF